MIRVDSVSKFYGARQALKAVTFAIESGEVVGFLGKNGAGKTTMLRILCGLLVPSSGHVSVHGVDGMTDPQGLRRLIGFLPDRPPLYPDMTVRNMLAYVARLHGVEASEVNSRVTEVLQLAQLQEVADDLIEWLSHGYRQRVGIAQAIVHKPPFVVLDEPISGLDPTQIVAMRHLIRGLKLHHTVLLSSHILQEISETCDRILVLHDGEIVAQGTEAELLAGTHSEVNLLLNGSQESIKTTLSQSGVVVLSVQPVGSLVEAVVRIVQQSQREELVALLVKQNIGVRSMSDARGGLEGLFLRLTQNSTAGTTDSTANSTTDTPIVTARGEA